MKQNYNRRKFIYSTLALGMGLSLSRGFPALAQPAREKNRVGIIGLDTSHSVAFTKALNAADAAADLAGYRVVAAYPKGSDDIKSSVDRIPGYIEEVKKLGVEIVDSIKELLRKVDVILLETNDGRRHLEQALQVIKAGKPLFIDKPVTASLKDAVAIYEAASRHNVPVFSSSSLRFIEPVQAVVGGKIGKVLGADTFSPATLEPTHPDLFWYGIHGVETLFAVMGTGCKSVSRVHTEATDLVVGTWADNRIGTFRGTRSGKHDYGGIAFGEKANASLGPFDGYRGLLVKIIEFFQTGKAPVAPEETLEILAFMEAADESRKRGGATVSLAEIMQRAESSASSAKP